MTIPTVLTVIGIMVTAFFGGWGVYVVLKRRYPGRIVLIKEESLGLFDSVVRNLPDLSISYKGEPVSQGLVLFKGALLNDGAKDIGPEMVEQKLSLNVPHGYKWLTAKVVSASPSVKAEVRVSSQSIEFETGLFRSHEHIRFEALAEAPVFGPLGALAARGIGEQLEKALEVTHRIADTQEVQTVCSRDVPLTGRRLRGLKTMTAFYVALGLGMWGSVLARGWRAETHFMLPVDGEESVEVSVIPRLDGTVKVKGVNEAYRESTKAEDFFQKEGLVAKIVPDTSEKYMLVVVTLVLVGGFSPFWVAYYLSERKMRRFRKLLSAGG